MAVIVLRALPGAGKTTLRKSRFPKAAYVSADDFHLRPDGSWVFDPTRAGDAHAACFREYLQLLRNFKDLEMNQPPGYEWTLIVDNTNTSAVEIAPYMLAAAAFEAKAKIVVLPCDPEQAISRNTHGVPAETIRKMAAAMEVPLPPWWAQETW